MNWSPLWHIVSNDKHLPMTERPELPWLHSFKETKVIVSNLLQKKTFFRNVPWEIQLVIYFFLALV